MNKIFGISLAAVLTAVPVVANAANGEVIPGDPGATVANASLASSAAGYSLAVEDGKEDMMVTAGYVKGAYNAAIKAINRVSHDTATALDSKQDTITNLSTIESGAADGAAAAAAIGSMTALQGGETLVEAINAVKATADSALTSASLEEYTTASEVTTAINSATASGSITVLTTWNSTAEETVPVNGTVRAAE